MKAASAGTVTYLDANGLNALKRQARNQSPEALQGAAREFEAHFLQLMLKNMRQATPESGMFGGEQTRLFRELQDKQIAQNMASAGGVGLAKVLARQLEAASQPAFKPFQFGPAPDLRSLPAPRAFPLHRPTAPLPLQRANGPVVKPGAVPNSKAPLPTVVPHDRALPMSTPEAYVSAVRPHAEAAAAELGVNPDVLVAQSALESGWGKRVLRSTSCSSHNLFGIKADGGWNGAQIRSRTLEFEAGSARQNAARFRAYDSYAQSFQDYVSFIRDNPRYADALRQAASPADYLTALQEAGFATDPRYAEKVQRIMQHPAIRMSGLVASHDQPNTQG